MLPKPYYQDESCTIYHADCREILPLLPKVDFLLTDPSYDIVAEGGGIVRQRKYLSDISGFTDCGFDSSILDPIPNWACFCSKGQLTELLLLAQKTGRWMLVTWNKPNPTPLLNGNYLPDTEYIVHRFTDIHGEYGDRSRYIVWPSTHHHLHPNEKPLHVVSKMVRVGSGNGDTILDPFMGSGTTLVAAKQLGRRAIGIEIKEKFCEVSAKRLEQSVLALATTEPICDMTQGAIL